MESSKDSVQRGLLQPSATEIVRGNMHNRPLLLQRHRLRLTEEDLRQEKVPRGESPSGKKGRKAFKSYCKGNCTNPLCNFWHPPVCQNYKSETGCNIGDTSLVRHTEAGKHSKKSQNSGGKDRSPDRRSQKHLGCVPQDTEPPKKSILQKSGKMGSNCTVKFSKGMWHHIKNSEKKGSVARGSSKV